LKQYTFYMHKYGMDACLYVNHIKRLSNGEHVADVSWYNLGYSGFPWLVYEEVIFIKDASKWIDISDKFMHTRTQSGLP
jgi:hypothetical protein